MPKSRIGQCLKFRLRQQLFALKEFCMENRFSDIFKTTNVTKLIKGILKSSYRILQVTSKCKTLKQPAYFKQSNWQNFDYIQGKVANPNFLGSPQKSLKTSQHLHQLIHPLRNTSPLKKFKNCLFGIFLFKMKIVVTF